MGTCKKCGRSGLFVAVDKNGLCKRCREEQIDSLNLKRVKGIALLDKLYTGFAELEIRPEPFDLYDPKDKHEIIPFLKDSLDRYQKLIDITDEILSDEQMYSAVDEQLRYEITYADEVGEKFDIKGIPRLGISYIYLNDQSDKKAILEKFRNNMETALEACKANIIAVIENDEDMALIDSVPYFVLRLDNNGICKKHAISAISGLKLSEIDKIRGMDAYSDFVAISLRTSSLEIYGDVYEIAAVKFGNWQPVEKFDAVLNTEPDSIKRRVRGRSAQEVISNLDSFIGDFSIVLPYAPEQLRLLYKTGYDMLAVKDRRYYDILRLSEKVLKTNDQAIIERLDADDPDYPVDYSDVIDAFSLEDVSEVYNRHLFEVCRDSVDKAFLHGQLFHDIVYHTCNGQKEQRVLDEDVMRLIQES